MKRIMKNWFRITTVDGDCRYVHSNRGWVDLIPYVAKLSNNAKYNGATVGAVSLWEGLLCSIRMFFGDTNYEEV